jgi:hypothetical protein
LFGPANRDGDPPPRRIDAWKGECIRTGRELPLPSLPIDHDEMGGTQLAPGQIDHRAVPCDGNVHLFGGIKADR